MPTMRLFSKISPASLCSADERLFIAAHHIGTHFSRQIVCHCTRTRSPSSTFHDALCMTQARSVSVLRAPIITPNKNTFDSFVFRHATAYRCSRCACSAAIHIASSPARWVCTRDICTTGQAVRYYTGHTSLSSVHVCRASRPREGGAGSRREPRARGADREQTGEQTGEQAGEQTWIRSRRTLQWRWLLT